MYTEAMNGAYFGLAVLITVGRAPCLAQSPVMSFVGASQAEAKSCLLSGWRWLRRHGSQKLVLFRDLRLQRLHAVFSPLPIHALEIFNPAWQLNEPVNRITFKHGQTSGRFDVASPIARWFHRSQKLCYRIDPGLRIAARLLY
jgi:hypothetical protein